MCSGSSVQVKSEFQASLGVGYRTQSPQGLNYIINAGDVWRLFGSGVKVN